MRCVSCEVGWAELHQPCWNCGCRGETGSLEGLRVLDPPAGTKIPSTNYSALSTS